jgi:hypothetical protein
VSNLPMDEKKALEAFEAHRLEQVKILGMPGLMARPAFLAGYRAAMALTEEAVKQERERANDLLKAARAVAFSNGFDAAYPDKLARLQAVCRSRALQQGD